MDLAITREQVGGSDVLQLAGRLNGAAAGMLEAWLRGHAPVPAIWDVSGLAYVSSAGLRVLLSHEKSRRQRGDAPTCLAGLQPAVRDLLSLTGVLPFWRQAATVADAVATTAPDAAVAGTRTPATTLVRWSAAGGAGASLDELAVGFGSGGIGARRETALARPARFASVGGLLCLAFDDGEGDTLPVADPASQFLRLEHAWSLRGAPVALPPLAAPLPLARLRDAAPATGWVGIAALLEDEAGPALLLAVAGPGAGAGAGAGAGDAIPPDAVAIPLATRPVGDEGGAIGWTGLVEQLPAQAGEGLRATLPETLPAGTPLWAWPAAAPRDAREVSLQVSLPADRTAAPDETELLVRSLYAGCSRVELAPLAGGFSATTWQVESFDAQGRRLLPTVLKVGPPAMMHRENAAHERHVRPFILNNASIGMGVAEHGGQVGLRYNFVGISGEGGGLRTLQQRWMAGDHDAVIALYGTAARETLRPWYGQARVLERPLYADHSPLRLFPGLPDVARGVLGDLVDAPRLPCPALGRDLPNPWRFLREEWPRRQAATTRVKVAIAHGDLNLNNLLADARGNLYVIDFSETFERGVGSDFARLEPVLLVERATFDDDDAEADWLRAAAALYDAARPWHGMPDGALPGLPRERAAFIAQLRTLAAHYLGDDAPDAAWLLPVFEWTLPIILFGNLPLRQRRASTWAAALVLERLLAADG